MQNAKLLIAEDDADLGSILAQYLQLQGYTVTLARNGEEAWQHFTQAQFDLCIIDVMMPVMDGFTLAERMVKRSPQTPFVFLTARGQKADRLRGLGIGADDYISKPFDAEELVLRVQNILKRTGGSDDSTIVLGRYTVDFENLTLTAGGKVQMLTQKEAQLLRLLTSNPNRLIKRSEILAEIWGENDYFMGRSMDVFISRLRRFLQHESSISIETVRGVGFIFRIA